jgi:hypothetical protein
MPFSFPFCSLLLSPLVVAPSFECTLDVILLALFRSAAKKNDNILSFPK